jgi:transcription-repair coupling factor (superfamily II helicase)
MIKSLSELHVGSPVVHIDHGVGRYRGLETITVGDHVDEFLTLEYAGNAKLYVPISSLHLISRYSGTDESLAPLHKLGTDKWRTAKQKALEKIRDTAAELLEVYARREAKQGFQYEHPGQAYRTFCAQFPFEETPDQAQAINAVFQDMTRKQPMDRLVCGDVGFGKTEVAMRAAFIATHNGKQVAILVPTTLLAQQHYQSFQDRFADTPVKVEVLSRFKTGKEQTKALQQLEDGVIDIVVGTHKLIQGDIKFKNLGLLIIDEEHRFGVQQKEKLKAYRAEVDILALTATPIPRTLNMAMGGVRDLSIIATPPAKRLSIKTFIRQKEDALIREAVLREVLRGGQVYYLFNDVKHIEKEVAYLQALIPESRVSFAHGQMRERDLEQAMSDFYHMRFNVLVCSTIIETGIDIPNANTIIINRSDMFGLAQLHQLRGRVGRSHHQAYAYLMTSAEKRLTKDAEKRLEAISAAQDLGAGFMLATHDLEIRGAGELLGEEQSGQIQSIGFTLYMELLEQAVSSLQAGKALSLEQSHHGAEINLRISALIPDDYLPDVHGRLVLYKRIASASHQDALKDIQVEMIDRFGLLPNPVKNLFKQTELKLLCESLGIEKIDAGASSGHLEFSSDTKVDPLAVVTLVQKRPDLYKLEGATKLRFEFNAIEADEKIMEIKSLLDKLIKA